MFKFFRKIRGQLLIENKFTRYFLYAAGEILLVVIGILIALQINNWNEDRKTREFEMEILSDILVSIDGHFFQIDMALESHASSIQSIDIILHHLEKDLPYHDSLDVHFSQSFDWVNVAMNNAGYESLKTYGRNLISSDSIRTALGIYETGWLERLAQRQEDYFYNSAAPILTKLFETVAMRSKSKPFNYEALKSSNEYLSILKTTRALRIDQNYWYSEWRVGFFELKQMIIRELQKQD